MMLLAGRQEGPVITECWYAGGGDPTGSFACLTRGLFIMTLLGALVVLLQLRRRNLDFLHTYIHTYISGSHYHHLRHLSLQQNLRWFDVLVYWLTHVGLAQSCTVDDLTCGSGWVWSENLQEHTGRVEKSQRGQVWRQAGCVRD